METNSDKYVELEIIKYLRDLSEKESDRFWKRNNVFVTINAGLLAFLISSYSNNDNYIVILICVFGFITSLAWFQISRTGKYYAQRWRNASKELAKNNYYIKGSARILCGQINVIKKPKGPSSSNCIKCVALITAIIWLLVASISIFKNSEKTSAGNEIKSKTLIKTKYYLKSEEFHEKENSTK